MNLSRPIRKDEIVLEEQGVFLESWLPERRSRHRPILFVHGELAGSWVWERYLGYFAQRGWEGHALNLQAHFWSEPADVGELGLEDYVADVEASLDQLTGPAIVVGHGMGGLLALKAAESRAVGALVLVSPALPAEVRIPPRPHLVREVPDVYGREFVGWQAMPEQLHRKMPDLAVEDVLRIQHLMGRESGSARRTMLQGLPVDRDALVGVPALVIGGGLDRWFPEPDSERLAEWLGATYEPFGAHSHFGLVIGVDSYAQVAETIRSFLESYRL